MKHACLVADVLDRSVRASGVVGLSDAEHARCQRPLHVGRSSGPSSDRRAVPPVAAGKARDARILAPLRAVPSPARVRSPRAEIEQDLAGDLHSTKSARPRWSRRSRCRRPAGLVRREQAFDLAARTAGWRWRAGMCSGRSPASKIAEVGQTSPLPPGIWSVRATSSTAALDGEQRIGLGDCRRRRVPGSSLLERWR